MYIADSLPLTTQRLSKNQCLILDHRLKSVNVYQGRHFINVIVFDGITKSRGTSIDHTGGKIGVPDSRFHGKHLVIPYFTHRKGRVHVSPKMTPKLKLPLAKCHKTHHYTIIIVGESRGLLTNCRSYGLLDLWYIENRAYDIKRSVPIDKNCIQGCYVT